LDDAFDRHVQALLDDALAEGARANWTRARALAQAACDLDPGHPDARRLLAQADAALAASPGERRQLTVMFIDVVGSTALASRADPETVRDLLEAYQQACAAVVRRYDGYISQYVGDGVIVYFGYPNAHEDDARRAVEAGLDVLDRVADVAAAARRDLGLDLKVRVAAHTGMVVRAEMGDDARRVRDAIIGETPNIAARLQEHAPPGSLVITAQTRDLVRDFFDVESLGRQELRGVGRPIEAFRVLRRVPADSRLDAARDPTPFVNRERELADLIGHWQAVRAGGSRAVLLRGEAGMGKSRLAAELRRRVADAGGAQISCTCSPYRTDTPLYPVRRLLSGTLGGGDPEAVRRGLGDALTGLGREDLAGAFADLLNLGSGTGRLEAQLEGQRLHVAMLDTLVRWLSATALAQPILVVVDDLQWADASTLELVGRVIAASITGLFLVLTARAEVPATWGASLPTMELGALAIDHLRALAASLPEGRDLDPDSVDEMVRRSEGVPLFLEELVRASASSGPALLGLAPPDPFRLPPALVEPLLARLASPPVDLSVIQIMATIGREADGELLSHVTGVSPSVLDDRMQVLIDARLVEKAGRERRWYRFRHHLLAELAYQTQLLPVRRQRHSAIADALLTLELPGVPADAGTIAHHLEQAARYDEAVDAHLRAAADTMAGGAITESVAQLDHAFSLIDRIDDEKARLGLELSVRQARALASISIGGYASPPAVADLERCVDICREFGPMVDGIPSLMVLWYTCVIRGELDRAEDVILVDRRRLDAGPHAMPEEAAWSGLRFGRGQITEAIAVMEKFLSSTYARELGATPAGWPLPDDPVVNTWSVLGLARWMACDPDGSAEAFRRAEERVELLVFPHGPFCRAYVKLIQILVFELAGRRDEARASADELEAIGARHGFVVFVMSAALHRAAVQSDGGVGFGAAWDGFRMLGMDLWNGWGYSMVAAERLEHGDASAAMSALLAAEAEADRTGAHFWSAETTRLKGEARLAQGDTGGVDDLTAAVALAQAQGARLFELRALLSWHAATGASEAAGALRAAIAGLDDASGVPELDRAREVVRP
jgi:class 3 adenylate cyclase